MRRTNITWRIIPSKSSDVYEEYTIVNNYCNLEFLVSDRVRALQLCHLLNTEIFNSERITIDDESLGLYDTWGA